MQSSILRGKEGGRGVGGGGRVDNYRERDSR